MRERTGIALLATMLPAIAAAQDSGKYECSYGEMVRRVEVAHEPGIEETDEEKLGDPEGPHAPDLSE